MVRPILELVCVVIIAPSSPESPNLLTGIFVEAIIKLGNY
jgi:hypothetical protein